MSETAATVRRLARRLGGQSQVAEMLEVHRSSVSRWLRESDVPDAENKAKLEALGALYCSRRAASAVCEAMQFLRGHSLSPPDLRRPGGRISALATLELAEGQSHVDLDDPESLLARRLRPSRVATGERDVSQEVARGVYAEVGSNQLAPLSHRTGRSLFG